MHRGEKQVTPVVHSNREVDLSRSQSLLKLEDILVSNTNINVVIPTPYLCTMHFKPLLYKSCIISYTAISLHCS